MRAVNLLPRQHAEQTSDKPRNVVGLVAAVGGGVVAVGLIAGFLLSSHSVSTQEDALASAKTELAAVTAPKVSPRASAKRAALLSDRERRALALATAIDRRVSWDRVLRRMALVLPDDVWLTDLTATKAVVVDPATAAAAAAPAGTTSGATAIPPLPSALTIQGYTYSQDGVARLLSRLEVIPDLKNVQLQTSKTDEVGGRKIISFTILSDIRSGGDAA